MTNHTTVRDPSDNTRVLGRRLLGTAAAVTLGGVVALGTAPAAMAHDELLESSPENGATLTEAPDDVTLTFSGEPLDGEGLTNLVEITDDDGNSWQAGDVTIDGNDLTTELCEGMPNGDYSLDYRVIYSDGHVGEEALEFTLDDPQAPEEGEPEENCSTAGGTTQTSDAASQDAAATGAETGQPTQTEGAETATAAEGAESAASEAPQTDAAPDAESADTEAASENSGVPGWVWVVGIAALIVVVIIAIVVARAARKHDDELTNNQ